MSTSPAPKSIVRSLRGWENVSRALWRSRSPHEFRITEGERDILAPIAHVNGSVLFAVDHPCMKTVRLGCVLGYLWVPTTDSLDLHSFPALVAHFEYQARDVCIARKVNRHRDDVKRGGWRCPSARTCGVCHHNVSTNLIFDEQLLAGYAQRLRSACPLCFM